MLLLTKIFDFETAHAIDGYNGMCKNIHGHSYELHVTVGSLVIAAVATYLIVALLSDSITPHHSWEATRTS